VENAYRQSRGAKLGITGKLTSKANSQLCERIAAAERRDSPEGFRLALWNYLDTRTEWLRDQHWPLLVFLRDTLTYLPNTPKPAGIRPVLQSQAPSPTQTSSPARKTLLEPLVEKWNRMVPECPAAPVGKITAAHISKAEDDPEFAENVDLIFEKAARIIRTGLMEGICFGWLFLGKPDPHWHGILHGNYSWAESVKKKSGSTQETVGQKMLREMRERDESGEVEN
jgi:hypothetical protein